MTDDASLLASNIARVRERLAAACDRTDRDPQDVTLIGVTKTHPACVIADAYAAGLHDFGESRVQEAGPKILELCQGDEAPPTWHMVGHLQRNKVAAALELFDVIHSVDTERLAEEIAARANAPVRVLLEVNVAGEASKSGVVPENVAGLSARIAALGNIDLIGLMTVAPETSDPETARPVFRLLRQLRDAIGLNELSMGMTGDFEVAVEEGATFVRVGRAIFGERAT